MLWPVFRYEREGTRERWAVRPFIFSTERDAAKDRRKTSVLWPFSGYERTGAQTDVYLFPLLWHGRAPESRYDVLFPVYWDMKDRNSRTFHVWPLFGVSRSSGASPSTEYSTVWPFFRWERAADSLEVSALWPFGHYERRPGALEHRLFPLYRYEETSTTSSRYVFPYYRSRSAHESRDVVFPLYFGHDWADQSRRLGLPLYYGYRSGDYSFSSFLPFYFHSRDAKALTETTYWFPLYGERRRGGEVTRRWLAFPLYAHGREPERGAESWDVLWPLFRYERAPGALDLRLFGPVYMDSRDDASKRSLRGVLFPLFGQLRQGDRERDWLFPVYYRQADAGGEWMQLWPLYGRARRGTYRERSTVWPFFRRGEDPAKELTISQFLLFYRRTEPDHAFTTVFPLWRRDWTPERTESRSLLVEWEDGRKAGAEERRFSFLCAASCYLSPDVSLIRYRREPGKLRHGVFPLYSYARDDKADSREWSLLWPLFSWEKRGELERQGGFLWKVVSYESRGAERSDLRVLWRLVRVAKDENGSTFELNPLYSREKGRDGSSSWNVLGGLIGGRTNATGEKKLRLLWAF